MNAILVGTVKNSKGKLSKKLTDGHFSLFELAHFSCKILVRFGGFGWVGLVWWVNGPVVSGGHISFQNNLPEWFM